METSLMVNDYPEAPEEEIDMEQYYEDEWDRHQEELEAYREEIICGNRED